VTLRGFEAVPACVTPDNRLGKPAAGGDAESGADGSGNRTPALADPDLARVVEAWATLPGQIRRAVLALIQAGGGGG